MTITLEEDGSVNLGHLQLLAAARFPIADFDQDLLPARTDAMGWWAKRVVLFNSIRDYGKQSIRSLADRTGLSKSSVHRHLQAIERRDRYPASPFWETPEGRAWLIRLVVATLFVFGLKRGERLQVEFTLDDALASSIRLKGEVRWALTDLAGIEFICPVGVPTALIHYVGS
ncbi:helix-turn-helix domain-containing protein [Candidatus Entotheonella palauensis]|uniref:helix-turn-helix domain-containing protein n=1 Tax=Candidatus Entotheonella palauensis TaxID=93172 RepID=UPI000B7EB697|nr:helix-turn-helix domain-containing protein [Candidatus Entotheonella palauensis]